MYLAEKRVWALLGMLLTIPSATAAWAPDQAEMAALPPYCAARFNEGSAAFKTWRSTMGEDFIHVHHYCAGLNFLNRARGMSSSKTRDILGATVREFDYVLSHAAPDFSLRAEILMNRGIALSMLKRNGEAVGNLLKAIELDPKQPRAYMTLTDLYATQKNRTKALETVTEGLRHNPDTRSLQRRYTELGGKLPYPEPLAKPTIPAPVAVTEVPTPQPTTVPEEPPSPNAVTPEDGAPPTVSTPPKIGSPTNPWCRFCPGPAATNADTTK